MMKRVWGVVFTVLAALITGCGSLDSKHVEVRSLEAKDIRIHGFNPNSIMQHGYDEDWRRANPYEPYAENICFGKGFQDLVKSVTKFPGGSCRASGNTCECRSSRGNLTRRLYREENIRGDGTFMRWVAEKMVKGTCEGALGESLHFALVVDQTGWVFDLRRQCFR